MSSKKITSKDVNPCFWTAANQLSFYLNVLIVTCPDGVIRHELIEAHKSIGHLIDDFVKALDLPETKTDKK